MERVILHCDCNSFFASCETVLKPELKLVPMAVCGDPENRHGIILAKNELAKRYGIETAETVYAAKRKCPGLVLVRSHHQLYEEMSIKANNIYREYTDMVEPFGIDESWLDVTNSRMLFGSGKEIADTIRRRFREELGITCSVGVSFNKTIAKLASDYKKPDATTVILRANFEETVWKLPVSALLYVGKNATEALRRMYIFTIGDLAQSDRDMLIKRLGKSGGMLHDYANGIDPSPVRKIDEKQEQKSVSAGCTFRRDLVSEDDIKTGVLTVANELSARLRRHKVKCVNLGVTVKYFDFTSQSRQKQFDGGISSAKLIFDRAYELTLSSFSLTKPVRSITLSANKIVPENESFEHMSLFSDNTKDKYESLENALDSVRKKYGSHAVEVGSLMNKDI